MFELHYNRSLESTDVIEAEPFQVGERLSDIQVLNATFSTTFVVGNDLTLTTAYATPIGNSTDQAFDGEFRLFVNWYFGGPNAALPALGQFGPAY